MSAEVIVQPAQTQQLMKVYWCHSIEINIDQPHLLMWLIFKNGCKVIIVANKLIIYQVTT